MTLTRNFISLALTFLLVISMTFTAVSFAYAEDGGDAEGDDVSSSVSNDGVGTTADQNSNGLSDGGLGIQGMAGAQNAANSGNQATGVNARDNDNDYTAAGGTGAQMLTACTNVTKYILPGIHVGSQDSGTEVNNYALYVDYSNGPVVSLQKFLRDYTSFYPNGQITGYFGPATEAAVKAYQASRGIVSSGSWDTTGYGGVGPSTARAMQSCAGVSVSSSGSSGDQLPANTTQMSGTLSVTSCTPSSGGTCGVKADWTSVNSVWTDGQPLTNTTVVDVATNQLPGGNTGPNASQYQRQHYGVGTSGSDTITLSAGTYNFILYGWKDGVWVILAQQQVVVGVNATVVPLAVRGPAATVQTGSTDDSRLAVTATNAPTGSLTVRDCQAAPNETCGVITTWTTANSWWKTNTPLAVVNVVDNATQNYVGGTARQGVSYYQSTQKPNGSYVFDIPAGSYTFALYGWKDGAYVLLDQKQVTVTQGLASTVTSTSGGRSSAVPTGTLTTTDCTVSSVGGTCGVASSWTTERSMYGGAPYSVVNVVDNATNDVYGGTWVQGTSQYTVQANSGSNTFNLPVGSYSFQLYGWYNDEYVLLDYKTVTVRAPQQPGAVIMGLTEVLRQIQSLLH